MAVPRVVTRTVLCAVTVAALAGGVAHAEPGPAPGPPVDPGPTVSTGPDGTSTPSGHPGRLEGVVPMWAPPPPRPPDWAPWLPVVWNSAVSTWGVWWNGSFLRL